MVIEAETGVASVVLMGTRTWQWAAAVDLCVKQTRDTVIVVVVIANFAQLGEADTGIIDTSEHLFLAITFINAAAGTVS